jgi:hypothetical protein
MTSPADAKVDLVARLLDLHERMLRAVRAHRPYLVRLQCNNSDTHLLLDAIAVLEASADTPTEAVTDEMIDAGVAEMGGRRTSGEAVAAIYTAMQAARPIDRMSEGVPASPSGHSAKPEPEEVSVVPTSGPNALERAWDWEVGPCVDRLGHVQSWDINVRGEPDARGVAVIASVYSGEAVARAILAACQATTEHPLARMTRLDEEMGLYDDDDASAIETEGGNEVPSRSDESAAPSGETPEPGPIAPVQDDDAERLRERLAETQMLASKWMEAHDCLKAGKPYDFPQPANLPNEVAALKHDLERSMARENELLNRPTADHSLVEALTEAGKVVRLMLADVQGGKRCDVYDLIRARNNIDAALGKQSADEPGDRP